MFHQQSYRYESVCTYVYVCAKLLQSCPTLCGPMDCTSRLLCPQDFPGESSGVGCHALLQGIFLPKDRTHVSYVSCIGRSIFSFLVFCFCFCFLPLVLHGKPHEDMLRNYSNRREFNIIQNEFGNQWSQVQMPTLPFL